MMVAALFVESKGVYTQMEGVDSYDIKRDAKTYRGPHSVVCHSPCQRFGRYWFGGPSAKVRCVMGDDDGCFESALNAVRTYGGVLEHPEASHAWAIYGIAKPPKTGGWVPAGDGVGFTCCVEQGWYGHKARKATWLYCAKTDLPELRWGKSPATARLDEGFQHTAQRKAARAAGIPPLKRLSTKDNLATPLEFAEILVAMARSVKACNDQP